MSTTTTASSSTTPDASTATAPTEASTRAHASDAGGPAANAPAADEADRPYRLPRGIGPASAGKCTAPDLQIDVQDPHHISLEEEIFGLGVGEVSITDPADCP